MKPSDFQKTIQCQFECKLKKVTKGIVRNYQKELKRRKNKGNHGDRYGGSKCVPLVSLWT